MVSAASAACPAASAGCKTDIASLIVPTMSSPVATTLSKLSAAALRLSIMLFWVVVNPALLAAISNRVSPPSVRARTSTRSARPPSTTNAFCPFSWKPVPSAVATSCVLSGANFACSSIASAYMDCPLAIACIARVAPACRKAVAAMTAVDRNGLVANVFPISWASTQAAENPISLPPASTGIKIPAQPMSTICVQSTGSWVSPASRSVRKWPIGAAPSRKPRAISASMVSSSVLTSFTIAVVLFQIKNAARDDAKHHFGCAAFD